MRMIVLPGFDILRDSSKPNLECQIRPIQVLTQLI